MAGIAFRLQKLLAGESYTDLVRAYLYSAFISSGPFVAVIVTMGVLRTAAQSILGLRDGETFTALVIYAYTFSLLGTAPFLYVVTRYLADRHYLKELASFTPAYLSVLEPVFVLQGIAAAFFLKSLPLSFGDKTALFCLYLVLSGTWVAMIFISAARSYSWIVGAFLLGGAISALGAYGLGRISGFGGFLLGFTAGQGACFAILTARVFVEFGYASARDYSYARYFLKYPDLALVGVLYYLGITADKMFFWFSSAGTSILPGLRLCADYDVPLFLAYVTVIPSMAFFLVEMETSFARRHAAYYLAVRSRSTLATIRRRRREMINDVSRQFQRFVVFQGAITAAVILFLYEIAEAFTLNPEQLGTLRIGLLGAFLHMGLVMVINILFYFDLRRDVLGLSALYLFLNFGLTAASAPFGATARGFGYAGACFATLLAGFLVLDWRLRNLDYLTFMKQPVLQPKFSFEAEGKKEP